MKISYNLYKSPLDKDELILNVSLRFKNLSKKRSPKKIIFIIDNSLSSAGENIYIFKKTLKRIIKILKNEDEIVIGYSLKDGSSNFLNFKINFKNKKILNKKIDEITCVSKFNFYKIYSDIKKENCDKVFFTNSNLENDIKFNIKLFKINKTKNFEYEVLSNLDEEVFKKIYENFLIKIKGTEKEFYFKKLFYGDSVNFNINLRKKNFDIEKLEIKINYLGLDSFLEKNFIKLKYKEVRYPTRIVLESIFFSKLENCFEQYNFFIKKYNFYVARCSLDNVKNFISKIYNKNLNNLIYYYNDSIIITHQNLLDNCNKSNYRFITEKPFILSKKVNIKN